MKIYYYLKKRITIPDSERVGTAASAICRLERADYGGHSLSMLRRIGAALGRQVRIAFVPMTEDVEVKAAP